MCGHSSTGMKVLFVGKQTLQPLSRNMTKLVNGCWISFQQTKPHSIIIMMMDKHPPLITVEEKVPPLVLTLDVVGRANLTSLMT